MHRIDAGLAQHEMGILAVARNQFLTEKFVSWMVSYVYCIPSLPHITVEWITKSRTSGQLQIVSMVLKVHFLKKYTTLHFFIAIKGFWNAKAANYSMMYIEISQDLKRETCSLQIMWTRSNNIHSNKNTMHQ